ncbi:type II toxin-antitoxin system YafQ family toxin [Actinomyces israelii]|uniref:Type II toxin-antitoxin system YafQ family toxin n=1 Tax=Actinomyces israelii TaxID=1659 RepID=A0ABT4I6H6_9ACTO|nr:type II toxin-antitoxin system YafQ family toxin [Actinomyces israelii]MCZ0857319.1 type II toxin-antitoxin system YafQ family toxin [Actinomyces israelii]WKR22435.1 mRNA interferase toxin YafQ [Actinomyces israelii]
MLDIVISSKCRKDLKRARRCGLDMDAFFAVVEMLRHRETLPVRYRDHALTADRAGLRDCHIRPDWVLIYQIRETELVLVLVETGSHADLGL